VRQEDGELVAADAEGAVGPTQGNSHELAEAAQDAIAGGMPAAVVDRLEVIEVDEQQRERNSVAQCRGDLAVELLVEGAVVAKARERVPQRVGQGRLVAHLQVGLGGDHRGDGAPQRQAADRECRRGPGRDGDEVVRGRGQYDAMGHGEGNQRQDDTAEQTANQDDGRCRRVRSGVVVSLHAALLRVCPRWFGEVWQRPVCVALGRSYRAGPRSTGNGANGAGGIP
jgi:hypothetical protein